MHLFRHNQEVLVHFKIRIAINIRWIRTNSHIKIMYNNVLQTIFYEHKVLLVLLARAFGPFRLTILVLILHFF